MASSPRAASIQRGRWQEAAARPRSSSTERSQLEPKAERLEDEEGRSCPGLRHGEADRRAHERRRCTACRRRRERAREEGSPIAAAPPAPALRRRPAAMTKEPDTPRHREESVGERSLTTSGDWAEPRRSLAPRAEREQRPATAAGTRAARPRFRAKPLSRNRRPPTSGVLDQAEGLHRQHRSTQGPSSQGRAGQRRGPRLHQLTLDVAARRAWRGGEGLARGCLRRADVVSTEPRPMVAACPPRVAVPAHLDRDSAGVDPVCCGARVVDSAPARSGIAPHLADALGGEAACGHGR